MVNICELLINVVTSSKLKVLTSLSQKVSEPRTGVSRSPVVAEASPAERQDLTQTGIQVKRGKPVVSPRVERPQGQPMEQRVKDVGKSESHPVIGWIGV